MITNKAKMRIRPDDLHPEEEPKLNEKLTAWTSQQYRGFMDYVAFREEDGIAMMAFKIILRLFGLLLMILLSPFLIIALIIAFAAVL
jgi:hypothetical protein